MSLYAVIGDIHGPWVDDRAVDLFLYIVKDLKISHLILNGDILDFYNINAHGPKDPDVQTSLEDELNWGVNFMERLRKELPKVEIIYIFGNHEFRLDRFIMKNAPAFWNMLRLEKMLQLKRFDIKWIPYNERYKVGNTSLFIQHSPPSYSDNAASVAMGRKMDEDHIWNCSHRTDMVARTGSSGKVYTSYLNGWFGSKKIMHENFKAMPENRKVFSFTKNHERWNTSFCLVSTDKKEHHVEQVLVKNYSCSVGGVVYNG